MILSATALASPSISSRPDDHVGLTFALSKVGNVNGSDGIVEIILIFFGFVSYLDVLDLHI